MADAPKRRWLPAFSIRTLLIATTLLCAYAACWWPTKTWGVRDVERQCRRHSSQVVRPTPIAPLIVAMDDWKWRELRSPDPDVYHLEADVIRGYYFWFFGYVAKLYGPDYVPTMDEMYP